MIPHFFSPFCLSFFCEDSSTTPLCVKCGAKSRRTFVARTYNSFCMFKCHCQGAYLITLCEANYHRVMEGEMWAPTPNRAFSFLLPLPRAKFRHQKTRCAKTRLRVVEGKEGVHTCSDGHGTRKKPGSNQKFITGRKSANECPCRPLNSNVLIINPTTTSCFTHD